VLVPAAVTRHPHNAPALGVLEGLVSPYKIRRRRPDHPDLTSALLRF